MKKLKLICPLLVGVTTILVPLTSCNKKSDEIKMNTIKEKGGMKFYTSDNVIDVKKNKTYVFVINCLDAIAQSYYNWDTVRFRFYCGIDAEEHFFDEIKIKNESIVLKRDGNTLNQVSSTLDTLKSDEFTYYDNGIETGSGSCSKESVYKLSFELADDVTQTSFIPLLSLSPL